MIFDRLEHLHTYARENAGLKEVERFLRENAVEELAEGRYELGHGVYCTVSESATREDGLYEVHRRYADVQLMIRGSERIDWAALADADVHHPYDEERDMQLVDCPAEDSVALVLKRGTFAVFYPQDAHKPLMRIQDSQVRKLVFKIPV